MKYLIEVGNKVIDYLKIHGVACELIGSLKKKGVSEHDIDVWIKDPDTKETRDKLLRLLAPKSVINTDWEGMMYE